MQRSDTTPFREPVDWQSLGIFDYPQIIKKPMDLGTVKKNIADRKYATITEAADDVRLVWTNCMTYNADGSDFFNLAKSLSKKWEDKYAKFLKDHNVEEVESTSSQDKASAGSTNDGQLSLEDKRGFARSLYKLSKEDLGKIIVEIDDRCPSALVKNAAEDECEMNVDKLTPELFKDLTKFVASCGKTSMSTKKKGTSAKRQKT